LVLVILYINGINAEKLAERRRITAEINHFFGRKSMLTGAQQQNLTNFMADITRSDVSICRITRIMPYFNRLDISSLESMTFICSSISFLYPIKRSTCSS
jgi:hypothetical protein